MPLITTRFVPIDDADLGNLVERVWVSVEEPKVYGVTLGLMPALDAPDDGDRLATLPDCASDGMGQVPVGAGDGGEKEQDGDDKEEFDVVHDYGIGDLVSLVFFFCVYNSLDECALDGLLSGMRFFRVVFIVCVEWL